MEDAMKNGKEPPSLDQRVAAVLTNDEHHPSSVLADLIAEVDDAIDAADQTGREARAAAADPKVIDGGALGRAFDAEHIAHRLRNGMAALQQLHHEAEARERLKLWHQFADEVEDRAVKLADEMLERYPALTSWLTDFLQRKSIVDKEIEHVNATAPGYEGRRLRSIELVARGIENWGSSTPIEKSLKLPQLVIGSSAPAELLWPPVVQFGVQMMGLFPGNGNIAGPVQGIARFELVDGVIRAIGANGEVLESIAVDQPAVEPLHAEMTMREQALQEQAERAVELARHADDSRARERERQRLNDARENTEFVKRQQAISR
jgi:hypothetical protein